MGSSVSYEWRLWRDGFEYFRAWLIAQRQQALEVVVKDPDALATVADRGRRASRGFEEFMHLARETYEEKTGEEMPDSDALFQEWSYLSQVNVGISMTPPR